MDVDVIPDKTRVFVDTSIFIYHFAGFSKKCTNFFYRVKKGQLFATVSNIVVAEMIQRRMIAEIIDKDLAAVDNVMRTLRENPDMIKGLSQYSQDVEDILSLPIDIESVSLDDLIDSKLNRREYGFLTNNSLNLACLKRLKINDIVTCDMLFENIPDLNIWIPQDLG